VGRSPRLHQEVPWRSHDARPWTSWTFWTSCTFSASLDLSTSSFIPSVRGTGGTGLGLGLGLAPGSIQVVSRFSPGSSVSRTPRASSSPRERKDHAVLSPRRFDRVQSPRQRNRFDATDPEVADALRRWGDVLLRQEDDGSYRPVAPQKRHHLNSRAWQRQRAAFIAWTSTTNPASTPTRKESDPWPSTVTSSTTQSS
jgi:hypothetical protein